MDTNLNTILEEIRQNPFEKQVITTPHTGVLTFSVKEGAQVKGPGGKWLQRPGSLLFTVERELNSKKIFSPCAGEVSWLHTELEGSFTEAFEPVLTIQYRLTKEKVIERILKQVLTVFAAPQRARYFLSPDFSAAMEKNACPAIKPGDEIFIMSLMKRDTILPYSGDGGVVQNVFFKSGSIVDEGTPLIGVCPPENLESIQKLIAQVRSEWE